MMTPRAKRAIIIKAILFALLGVYFCYSGIRNVGFARVILILIGIFDIVLAYIYIRGLKKQ